jgi:hypothetical protein
MNIKKFVAFFMAGVQTGNSVKCKNGLTGLKFLREENKMKKYRIVLALVWVVFFFASAINLSSSQKAGKFDVVTPSCGAISPTTPNIPSATNFTGRLSEPRCRFQASLQFLLHP